MKRALAAASLCLLACAALGQSEQVLTVEREGHSVSGLVTHLAQAKDFKHGVALFPGYPGIMRLRVEGGRPEFNLRGNFLIRSRHHWLDEETLAIAVDAPSDQWATFHQSFRETPRKSGAVPADITPPEASPR